MRTKKSPQSPRNELGPTGDGGKTRTWARFVVAMKEANTVSVRFLVRDARCMEGGEGIGGLGFIIGQNHFNVASTGQFMPIL